MFGLRGVVVLDPIAAAADALEGGAGMFGLRGVVVLDPLAAAASALDGRATDGPYDLNDIIYDPPLFPPIFSGEFCNCFIVSRFSSIFLGLVGTLI
jgi:hypothetical protein